VKKASILLCLFIFFSSFLFGCRGKEGQDSSFSSGGSDAASVSSADLSNMDFSFSDRDLSGEYDKNTNKITASEKGFETSAGGVQSRDDGLYITKGGTYNLLGNVSDKMICIEAGENDKVQLVLNSVRINNKNGPAIYIKGADKVFITLADGSNNQISDGSDYTFTDGETSVDAAIFSRADLCINGKGSLKVLGNSKHAVVSKDDLIVSDATLDVTSKNVALGGKDCIKISSANITAKAGSDALRSDNDEDAARGYIYIDGGALSLTAQNDAIQAQTVIKITGGSFAIQAGDTESGALTYSSESSKGVKAGSDIIISGGSFNINSLDDCIHSNGTISISEGTFTLSSSDDGIHADTDLSVSGGDISILQSYEGLEASKIAISGGKINIKASDDGINAAGGNDSSGMGGRPGQGMFSSGVGEIIISGGYTLIDASGDGIDSNSTVEVTGGITLVSGPTNGGNGSFDYDSSATVSGGVLIALGSSGMAQSFSEAQNQGAIYVSFSTRDAGTNLALCSSGGKVIASFTPQKAYQTAVITAPQIQKSQSYTIIAGGSVSGADQNGFAQNVSLSGGTTLAEIEMTDLLYGAAGHNVMAPGGHGIPGGPGGPMGRPGGFYR